MADATADALAVLALLLLGAGVVALRAVLDGRRLGVPASIAALAPTAEVARYLRSRPAGRRRALPVVAGTGLVAAAALRVLALPVSGPALLDQPFGVLWFVLADLVWWGAGALLFGSGRRRFLLRAVAVELPLLLALAVPVVAAGSLRVGDARAAQQGLPFAVEAPVALLVLLVVWGVLLPWSVAPWSEAPGAGGTGIGRLLVDAGLAVQPVSAAAVAAVLLLGSGGSPAGSVRLAVVTILLTVLLVVAARRFPVLPQSLVARVAVTLLLPIAVVQLAVVVALTLLGQV